MIKILFISLFTLLGLLPLQAQKRVGDFIESTSYNDDKRGTVRELQYVPEYDVVVCKNGNNRYTRALYGGTSAYRLETSDRPVFALFQDSRNCRNVSFRITYKGHTLALDSTTRCEARYARGQRWYRLEDKSWGGASLLLDVCCLVDADRAAWHFYTVGFHEMPELEAVVTGVREKRLHRNGDIGADKPGCLESDGEVLQRLKVTWEKPGFAQVMSDSLRLENVDWPTFCRRMKTTEDRIENYNQQVWFHTPDPFFNPLGAAIVAAADGAWDGETWLHGAVGWRMPLAGWRAGYLADVLGWNDRARSHFDAYAASQVVNVPPTIPHPSQDSVLNLARAEKKWGTQMYSNGYICRNPNRNDQMHHYDMNLNYIDELMWHFEYDADTAYMRKMWPVITRHLEWEKRNYDPDDDGLYDAYCCIWASDALYYNGGAVTHSSAYNYRANLMASKIARLIGEDGSRYQAEADKILKAMNSRLWLKGKNHWAEYQDMMGLKRVHEDAALWSIYTPIDCGACNEQQAYQATQYVDSFIPRLPLRFIIPPKYSAQDGIQAISPSEQQFSLVSTSDWMPYSWSINNVATAEVMNMSLAYFKAGRPREGFQLLKANILDQMYLGSSPGNFGQISFLDAARGECYRDFSDCTGTAARTIIQGLYGIVPHALDSVCVIRPGFPMEWEHAFIRTPYLSYTYRREAGEDVYEVEQHFRQPLKIILRLNLGNGKYIDHEGTMQQHQVFRMPAAILEEYGYESAYAAQGLKHDIDKLVSRDYKYEPTPLHCPYTASQLGLDEPSDGKTAQRYPVAIHKRFNAQVADIFKQQYLSPRPNVTTLQIPTQGVGEWCHPQLCPEINDSVLRTRISNGRYHVAGVPFLMPSKGENIAYTSLWDNYPGEITFKMKGQYRYAYLLLAGSTNHMQTRIDNAVVIVTYKDHTTDTLHLIPPFNWCPIEQDYYVDQEAFKTMEPRPYRLCLGTGQVSRDLGKTLGIKGVYGREIPGGAAQMLKMPLNPKKKLKSLTLRTLSNDVVVGLMAITLEK